MNLNCKSFLYRLYSGCYILSNKLFNKDSANYNGDIVVPTNTNLCTLMRTIFIWTPIYLLIFASLLFGIGYILIYLPNTVGGVAGYINTYVVPGLFIGGFLGFIVLIIKLAEKYEHRHIETATEKRDRHEAGNYTFWEIISKYFRSLHDKTCPLIAVVEDVPVKKAVSQSTSATPTPPKPDFDTNTPKRAKPRRSTVVAEKAMDSIIDSLDKMDEKPAAEKNTSFVVKFLNKFSPNFTMFAAGACIIGVVAFLNFMMSHIMQDYEVVFERAACTGTFNAEKQNGTITCGALFENVSTMNFVAKVIILKRVPVCEVTKGTLTDNVSFDCAYK